MLTQISNYTYKSFKNYTGPNVTEPFKQKNIFFGYNGKGKTALSKGILLELKKDKSITNENYRFFNKDNIKDSLLLDDNSGIKGVVANFGKKNVEIEKEIIEKKKLIKDTTPLQDEIDNSNSQIKNEIEKIFKEKKGNSSIKKKTSNNTFELIESYKEELKTVKDSIEYEKELNMINNTDVITLDILNDEEINSLSKIMSNKYNNNEIPSTLILSWLENGLEIHKKDNLTTCKFCGGNVDLNDIENRINEYHNDKKQQDLLELDKIYTKIKTLLSSKQLINDNNLLLSNIVGESVNNYYTNINIAIEKLKSISNEIDKKINDFENAYIIKDEEIIKIMSNISNNLKEIDDLRANKVLELNKMIDKCNILIKGSIALEISENSLIIKELNKLKEKNTEMEKIIKLNDKTSYEIDRLKKSKSTTSDFASFINDLLEELNVDFFLDISNNNYIIKHKREKIALSIDDISEGENNLLALLLFYYELFNDKFQKDFKNNIKMIIVDDPISSVDDINKIYVLEIIKKILNVKEPQIFIFTHVWEDFCNLCYGKQDIDKQGNETPYRFYEVKKNSSGSYIKKTKYNETPYMHDFKEIYEFSKLDSADNMDECEIYHYPNVMRKILEKFMEFKVSNSSPTLDNISNVKIALCGNVNNVSHQDEIQIPTLLDVCNIFSHKMTRNPEQILKSAQYLMRKIREIDINHYSTMIKGN